MHQSHPHLSAFSWQLFWMWHIKITSPFLISSTALVVFLPRNSHKWYQNYVAVDSRNIQMNFWTFPGYRSHFWLLNGARFTCTNYCTYIQFIPGSIPSKAQPLPLQSIKQGAIFWTKSQSKLWLCDWDPAPLSQVPAFIKTHRASINLFRPNFPGLTDVKHSVRGQMWLLRVSNGGPAAQGLSRAILGQRRPVRGHLGR